MSHGACADGQSIPSKTTGLVRTGTDALTLDWSPCMRAAACTGEQIVAVGMPLPASGHSSIRLGSAGISATTDHTPPRGGHSLDLLTCCSATAPTRPTSHCLSPLPCALCPCQPRLFSLVFPVLLGLLPAPALLPNPSTPTCCSGWPAAAPPLAVAWPLRQSAPQRLLQQGLRRLSHLEGASALPACVKRGVTKGRENVGWWTQVFIMYPCMEGQWCG